MEICVNGLFSTLCLDELNVFDSTLVCKALGYTGGKVHINDCVLMPKLLIIQSQLECGSIRLENLALLAVTYLQHLDWPAKGMKEPSLSVQQSQMNAAT